MSGICGIFQRDGEPVSAAALHPMMEAMQHYGREGGSEWRSGAVALGHLMTHNTPESSREKLPFEHPDAQLAISSDARLDNRGELCSLLKIPAREQEALPDSQLILRAYRQWGSACPLRLLGDFAFAIYDAGKNRLFCARDSLGIRPFYYYSDGRIFCFSSDLAALLASQAVPEELNLETVRGALVYPNFYHKEYTFYQDVYKLPPATSLVIEPEKITREPYWSPGGSPEIRFTREGEYSECLQELLTEAVDCRLRSSFASGSHLSSGLDSSTIAVIAARRLRERGQDLHTFSWAPPPTPAEYPLMDERAIVEAVSQREGTIQHYTLVTPQDIYSQMSVDITRHPSEMLLLESIVARQAAEHGLRVMLSGWGGDEMAAFNGRGFFADLLRRGRWVQMWRELSLRAKLHEGSIWQGIRNDAILPLLPDGLIRAVKPGSHLLPHELPLPGIVQLPFAERLGRARALKAPDLRVRPGVRENQIRLLLSGHLMKRIESWAANGARYGIEYRYPLLDRRIVEFSLSIPEGLFFKHGWKRYLFRQAGDGILPDEVRWQRMKVDAALKKQPPSNLIMAYKMLRDEILAKREAIQGRGYVNPDGIIQGLEILTGAGRDENHDPQDNLRAIWLAFVENGQSRMT